MRIIQNPIIHSSSNRGQIKRINQLINSNVELNQFDKLKDKMALNEQIKFLNMRLGD